MSRISTGLVPNTTYQFQVNSQNYAGTASSWVSLGSTVTLAAVPPAPLMGGVFITSAAVTINTGTNPYWTQYAIQVSSASGAWTGYVASPTGGFSSTAVYNTTTTWTSSVWVTNLSTNVAFTYSVQAINQYNKPTAFSTSVTSATLAAVPISFVVGNVYTSSMTVNWQSNGNSTYTVYEVSYSTDNFAANFSTASWLSSNLTALTTSLVTLSANTTYYARVRAYNINNIPTAFALMTATSTLANLPVLSSVQTSTWSINVNWTANGNSAGTLYTAKNITTNNSLTSSNTYWLDTTSLSPNTTYQYEVQAINNNSISTAWVIYNSTSTLAVTPPAPSLVNVSSTGISIAINTDANPYYTNYAIQISSWGGMDRLCKHERCACRRGRLRHYHNMDSVKVDKRVDA